MLPCHHGFGAHDHKTKKNSLLGKKKGKKPRRRGEESTTKEGNHQIVVDGKEIRGEREGNNKTEPKAVRVFEGRINVKPWRCYRSQEN